MPLTVNVGLSKKVGLPDYGSLGASCHVEVELDGSLVFSDLDAFHRAIEHHFRELLAGNQRPDLDSLLAAYQQEWTDRDAGHIRFGKDETKGSLDGLAQRMLQAFSASDLAVPQGRISTNLEDWSAGQLQVLASRILKREALGLRNPEKHDEGQPPLAQSQVDHHEHGEQHDRNEQRQTLCRALLVLKLATQMRRRMRKVLRTP